MTIFDWWPVLGLFVVMGLALIGTEIWFVFVHRKRLDARNRMQDAFDARPMPVALEVKGGNVEVLGTFGPEDVDERGTPRVLR